MHNPDTWPPRVPFIQVSMEREQWLSEAENAEKGSAPRTAQAIVKESISLGGEAKRAANMGVAVDGAQLSRGPRG